MTAGGTFFDDRQINHVNQRGDRSFFTLAALILSVFTKLKGADYQ